MFDIKAVEKKALEDIRKERETKATKEIKAKLEQIEKARLVLRNLEREYAVLLAEIGDRA